MAGPRYSILPADAVYDERVTGLCLRVLAALGAHTDNNGWCRVKQKTVAERIGSTAGSVREAVAKLVSLGYVRTIERYGPNGARISNFYQVIMDRDPHSDPVDDGIEAADDDEFEAAIPASLAGIPPAVPAAVPPAATATGVPQPQLRGPRSPHCGVNKNDLSLERPSSIEDRPTTVLLGPVPKGKAPRGGCSLPSDFQPDIAFAVGEGMTQAEAEREALRFADFWIGKPGKEGRKADWPATWRNWVRRAIDQLPKGRAVQGDKPKALTVGQLAAQRRAERRSGDVLSFTR